MAKLTERIFRATVLTPVHIGSGERLAPEDYLLDDKTNRLVRLRTSALLGDLPEVERRQLERWLLEGSFDKAWECLRKRGVDRKYWAWEVAVGKESAGELKEAVQAPERRRGEFLALLRNPYTGAVVIPGSALKGAIRTALLNACVSNPPAGSEAQLRRRIEEAKREGRNRAWQELESAGFRYDRERTETDPMRMVHVADAEVPASAVRVDRAVIVNRQGQEMRASKIQVHVERLWSQADGGDGARFPVRIALDEERLRDPRVRRLFNVFFDWRFLEGACNFFFMTRWSEEAGAFARVKEAVGEVPPLHKGEILLRVGRYCHFESLSVDDYREGWNAQRKAPIKGMGSSRTLCYTAKGTLAPFGWIVLRPEG
ncbi:MAG: type III-A CRISPR-associated RAMP protein Csm5 [Bryobacterales bacterium]|nr:type III-A CRISPR-associated RAMP protein Csm5 [Bryobacteraceae bacterium]MDW8355779.1 type III-A CRISPR-associated RAMP protein Csm5 [Bryobacterales bacterium]